MNDPVLYTPSEWQAEYHRRTEDWVLGAGSSGPGKSLALLHDCDGRIWQEHERCVNKEHPFHHRMGSSTGRGLHLRRTRPMLEQTIARSQLAFKTMDPGARYDTQSTTWHFSSGYRYQFGHCRNDDDWGNYLSNQYDWLGFDELTQFNQEQFEQLWLRVRSDDPVLGPMCYLRAMSTPFISRGINDNFTVNDPGWVKRMFVDPAPMGGTVIVRKVKLMSGKEVTTSRLYLRATLWDNPNKQFVEDYEKRLQFSKPHLRDAYLHGRWDVTVGSHFGDEWNHRLHVCRPFRISSDWPVFRSMDWGYKKPGCVHWWALDEDDNLFCIHEYTFKMKSPGDVAFAIERYEKEMGWWDTRTKRSKLTGPADTQLWEERGDVGLTKAQEMARNGVKWVPADKSSRNRNAQRVMDRLMDHDGGTTTPGLVVFDGAVNLIRTLPAIPSDPSDPETPMDGGDDHWTDSLFYAAAYAALGRKSVRPVPTERDPWEDEKEEHEDRGRHGYGWH